MSASRTRILVPVMLLVVVAVVIAGLLVNRAGEEEAAQQADADVESNEQATETVPVPPTGDPDAPAPDPDITRRVEGDPMALGPVDAPVGVVVYSDYSCPYCQDWALETAPVVVEYAEQGTVRLEARDIAILGEDSLQAAVAASAAAEQGRYWEFHELLFTDLDARSPEDLTAMAQEAGLDLEQFAADLGNPAVIATVQENMQEAQSLGLQSTPSFIVGGTPVVGAQPAEVFVEIIEQELARQQ